MRNTKWFNYSTNCLHNQEKIAVLLFFSYLLTLNTVAISSGYKINILIDFVIANKLNLLYTSIVKG